VSQGAHQEAWAEDDRCSVSSVCHIEPYSSLGCTGLLPSLPGPSPSRTGHVPQDTPASGKKPASKAKGTPHSRASSVASNVQDAPDDLPQTPSTTSKPRSSLGAKKSLSHIERTQTPDSTAEDRSSVGESSKTPGRARKSEAERMEFLQNDSHSGEVEPHRVFCTACQTWVELNPKRRYVMQKWVLHRKSCGKQRGLSERPELSDLKSEAEVEEDDSASVASPEKAVAEATPPSKSQERPSNRIAMAQRKLQLVNDPQVKRFNEHSAECAICRTEVSLKGSVEYDLTCWQEHKTTCVKSTPRPIPSPERSALPPPSIVVTTPAPAVESLPEKPPPSVASTDVTVVGSEPSPVRVGEKRPREEDEEEDQPRLNRPRTELYEVPEGDSPGFLDWVALPFRSFVRGLREGLSSG